MLVTRGVAETIQGFFEQLHEAGNTNMKLGCLNYKTLACISAKRCQRQWKGFLKARFISSQLYLARIGLVWIFSHCLKK